MDELTDRAGFYGMPTVPFHRHLALRFWRGTPDGPGFVTLPSSAGDPAQGGRGPSPSAVYTAAEVASALAVCDAMLPGIVRVADTMSPAMLTTGGTFRVLGPMDGDVTAEASVVGDPEGPIGQLEAKRKAQVEVDVSLLDAGRRLAAEARFHFYLRLMRARQLEAMMSVGTRGAYLAAQGGGS